ncbi:MAG: phosphatidylserine/phosphatidylglycerophosphate/cardiolipin synthase family protein [Proteobacteria bacterium]|jgi:cardiolipin synthase|nr:phosphatidylserine/phosphatidylglycerophosphate/cardiolipin synthase family protein [Pseudomonadota bacterium]
MMRVSKSTLLWVCGLTLAILTAAVVFVFNPMGLGPEPETVLSRDFFATSAQDLSQLELLVDGKEAFDAILEAIDCARSSIFVQIFIWKDDTIGQRIVAGLKAAAKRGVRVTVRKDMLGTFFEFGDMVKGKMSPVFTKAGLRGYENIDVDVDVFADTDHSKYFIVDERLAIFGGMNIGEEYHTKWHDYMVLIRSRQWTKSFADLVMKSFPWPDPSPFMVAVNNEKATEIRTALIQMIDNASESVIIEHAYFSDGKVIEAVSRAAQRGITVEIILPKETDTHHYANMATINRLLDSGSETNLRVFLYPHMSHAKVVLTDGEIAAVGSANLTPRSMLTCREVTLFVHGSRDDPFLKKLRQQLNADVDKSERILAPFKLSFTDRIKAVVGKYVW